MLLSLLFALTLQSAADAPVQTAPKAESAAPAAAGDTSDIPHGAPTDDFGFVAWCRGALSGHMALYPSVKPEMAKVEDERAAKEDTALKTDAERAAAKKRRAEEAARDDKLDQEQLDAGKTYIKLYNDALDAAETASATNLHPRRIEMQDAGFRIWSAARGAEPRTRMWSWIMWELPARCETAAKRLESRSELLAGVLKPQTIAPTLGDGDAADAASASVEAAPKDEAAPGNADGLRLRGFTARQPKLGDAPETDTPTTEAQNADAPISVQSSGEPQTPESADAPKP